MYSGQVLLYRIRLAPPIWTTWMTEITECHHDDEGAYFIDEQRQGPYVLWYHEHRFTRPRWRGTDAGCGDVSPTWFYFGAADSPVIY